MLQPKVLLHIRKSCRPTCTLTLVLWVLKWIIFSATYTAAPTCIAFQYFPEIRVAPFQGYLLRSIPILHNYIVQLERMACKCSLK